MPHEPTPMVYRDRYPVKHPWTIRNKPCERNVWYRGYSCPICGRTARRLANFKPKTPVCRGEDK